MSSLVNVDQVVSNTTLNIEVDKVRAAIDSLTTEIKGLYQDVLSLVNKLKDLAEDVPTQKPGETSQQFQTRLSAHQEKVAAAVAEVNQQLEQKYNSLGQKVLEREALYPKLTAAMATDLRQAAMQDHKQFEDNVRAIADTTKNDVARLITRDKVLEKGDLKQVLQVAMFVLQQMEQSKASAIASGYQIRTEGRSLPFGNKA